MPRLLLDSFDILVPRDMAGQRSHVLVKLTILNDRNDLSEKWPHEPLLEWSTHLLSGRQRLADKCEVTLTTTQIILHMLQQQPSMLGVD